MNITIKLTERDDLKNVQTLWADPAVMRFVGFPEGLCETMEYLETEWLPWVQCPPKRQHYSVYDEDFYCGESFYDVDETGLACMDIKLLPAARGKGIAYQALPYALDAAFRQAGAKAAYVDPDPENHKALALYRHLGFLPTERAAHLDDPGCPYVYLELRREDWLNRATIRYRDIVLRDRRESDIEDWIRWYNEETEWAWWDVPDMEPEPVEPEQYRAESMEMLKNPAEGFRSLFELDTAEGKHIGMVTSYAINENYQWISWQEAHLSKPIRFTLGIEICDSSVWGHGYGTQAMTAFTKHFLDNGMEELYLQTWTGNHRMFHVAKKLGYVECHRATGAKRINGVEHDDLTFKLDREHFFAYLASL